MDTRRGAQDAWLRSQEEARQYEIVNVNQPMCITPSLYFGTRRCTYSDVVSVVTTVKPLPRLVVETESPKKSGKKAATPTIAWDVKQCAHREPDAPIGSGGLDTSQQYARAPLDGDAERISRFYERQINALTQERTLFMESLRTRRKERYEIENRAALVIQRLHRGYVLRKRFMSMKEKLKVRKRIRVNIVKVTKGTAIITGEKERKARISEERHVAVWKIQCCFRQWIARRIVHRERLLQKHEWRIVNAIRIQRVWRKSRTLTAMYKLKERHRDEQRLHLARLLWRLFQGYMARQRVRRIRLRRQILASQRIQWFVQRVHASKARVLQHRRRRDERRNDAAVCIQRRMRGVLARARVWRLRIQEDIDIRVACALLIQRVFRGCRGRRRMRFYRVFHRHQLAWICATHMTRIVRGFLARRVARIERLLQETDLLVQTRKGNTSTVIDLLDGYGIVDEPVDLLTTRFETRNHILHIAAKHGHMDILTHVLPKFLDVAPHLIYASNKKGETALELAICYGHSKIASFLLTKTAELFLQASPERVHRRVLLKTGRERSLLLDAARNGMGSSIVTKMLVLFPQLFTGKEVDAWSKRTLLHEALLLQRVRRFESPKAASERNELIIATLGAILAKVPVHINAQDIVGFTALHLASMQGNLKAVKLLLEHGADVTIQDGQGRTAWRIALLFGHEACFLEIRRKWLNDVSSSPNSSVGLNNDMGDAQGMGKALTAAATKGSTMQTALHPQLARDLIAACRAGQLDRLQFLLEECHGSVNACDPQGESGDSLLMVALSENSVRIVRYLLTCFADQLEMLYVNNVGRSALDAALANPNLIALLVRGGYVNPCLPLDSLKHHRTVSHEAIRRGYSLRKWINGHTLMPSLLVPLVDDDGRTLLHEAAAFGNDPTARLLINCGCAIHAQTTVDGRTPLHEACRGGNTELVRLMSVQCPRALWVADANGDLPVVDAVRSSKVECVAVVVETMHATDDGCTDWIQRVQSVPDINEEVQAYVQRVTVS